MDELKLRDDVERASKAFSVVIANTAKLREEAYRLRYQVYCLERGYEPGDNGIEADEFDEQASHVLLVHNDSDTVVGTVRIVPPDLSSSRVFPMMKVCRPELMRNLPARTTGEISRFAISKLRRMGCRETTMVRLGLMHGILRLSEQLELTHWCAIMEPFLLRLLQMNAIYFAPMGPVVEYHGIRQPTSGRIVAVLDRIKREQPPVWEYITQNGQLWYGANQVRLVA